MKHLLTILTIAAFALNVGCGPKNAMSSEEKQVVEYAKNLIDAMSTKDMQQLRSIKENLYEYFFYCEKNLSSEESEKVGIAFTTAMYEYGQDYFTPDFIEGVLNSIVAAYEERYYVVEENPDYQEIISVLDE